MFSSLLYAQDEKNVTITGHVRYEKNGEPCKNKSIDLKCIGPVVYLSESTHTDSAGFYRFENIRPSVYIIKCYESVENVYMDTLSVTEGKNFVHDFFLKSEYSKFPPVILNMGAHQGWRTMGEISIGTCHNWAVHDLAAYKWYSLTLGTEFNFNPHHFIIGPKFTYNHQMGFIIGGLDWGGSLITYTDFDKWELYLHPHFGVNIITFLGLHLGYNIPLYSTDGDDPMHSLVNHFTVSLILSFMNHDKLLR